MVSTLELTVTGLPFIGTGIGGEPEAGHSRKAGSSLDKSSMTTTNGPEIWLRGPLPNMPTLLQPVAHALLQARNEVTALLTDFHDELLWQSPISHAKKPLASAGFHLQHLAGVLDRLFTYAQGQPLSPDQLSALAQEGHPPADSALTVAELVRRFDAQVGQSLTYLSTVDPQTLTETRGVGRAQVPSTVMGLLVHAAEHTMRHVGQLLVTVQVVKLVG